MCRLLQGLLDSPDMGQPPLAGIITDPALI
jgi:hypothetical protein